VTGRGERIRVTVALSYGCRLHVSRAYEGRDPCAHMERGPTLCNVLSRPAFAGFSRVCGIDT